MSFGNPFLDSGVVCRSDGECDEDTNVCTIKGCKAQASSISSFKVPDGLSLTMFSGNYFSGSSITYEGPVNPQP